LVGGSIPPAGTNSFTFICSSPPGGFSGLLLAYKKVLPRAHLFSKLEPSRLTKDKDSPENFLAVPTAGKQTVTRMNQSWWFECAGQFSASGLLTFDRSPAAMTLVVFGQHLLHVPKDLVAGLHLFRNLPRFKFEIYNGACSKRRLR
jgi:hypothetical protein